MKETGFLPYHIYACRNCRIAFLFNDNQYTEISNLAMKNREKSFGFEFLNEVVKCCRKPDYCLMSLERANNKKLKIKRFDFNKRIFDKARLVALLL